MINICVFEDDAYDHLLPFTYARPVYDLLLGTDRLFDKVERYFNYGNLSLQCRELLKPIVKHRFPGKHVNAINTGAPCLFINGRVVMTQALFELLNGLDRDHHHLITYKGLVVATYVRDTCLEQMQNMLQSPPSNKDLIQYLRPNCVAQELETLMVIENPWDLVHLNPKAIQNDFEAKQRGGILKGSIGTFSALYQENNIYIGKGSVVEDFVVLDGKNGPIYIDDHVKIEAGTHIIGPAYIGKNTTLLGGKIRSSSIHEHCKICGEVSLSVIDSFSNKSHHGFVGHSYVGQWVNMGAGTTTSNLKNTYGKITLIRNQKPLPTEQIFLGSLIGDHVKLGIGTLLNTGTILHFGANLFGSTLHDKEVTSFAWGEPKAYRHQPFEKFVGIADRVMARRNKTLSEDEKIILSQLYQVQFNEKHG